MANQKIIDVYCKNGHLLFGRYRKAKPGFLMKCYIDEIGRDYVGVKGLPLGKDVYCPFCAKERENLRIGRIGMVHGRPAVVVNHGGINYCAVPPRRERSTPPGAGKFDSLLPCPPLSDTASRNKKN